MSRILTHDEFQIHLDSHYIRHYGVRDSDYWYPAPAVNVRQFARGTKLVTLKCHILTGVVTESIEDLT
ncbi:MAG: hypothetical protein IIY11_05805 [Clostridia bacterium]|nr:hypothetical protein [Clostridia bacterium]MBQ2326890.1 hypothetical protein [Clostridia bacterium]